MVEGTFAYLSYIATQPHLVRARVRCKTRLGSGNLLQEQRYGHSRNITMRSHDLERRTEGSYLQNQVFSLELSWWTFAMTEGVSR